MRTRFFAWSYPLLFAGILLNFISCGGGGATNDNPTVASTGTKETTEAKPKTDEEFVGKFVDMMKASDPMIEKEMVMASFKEMVMTRPAEMNREMVKFFYKNDRVFQGMAYGSAQFNVALRECIYGERAYMAPAAAAPRSSSQVDPSLATWADAREDFKFDSDAARNYFESHNKREEGNPEAQVDKDDDCMEKLTMFVGLTYAAKDRLIKDAGVFEYKLEENVDATMAKDFAAKTIEVIKAIKDKDNALKEKDNVAASKDRDSTNKDRDTQAKYKDSTATATAKDRDTAANDKDSVTKDKDSVTKDKDKDDKDMIAKAQANLELLWKNVTVTYNGANYAWFSLSGGVPEKAILATATRKTGTADSIDSGSDSTSAAEPTRENTNGVRDEGMNAVAFSKLENADSNPLLIRATRKNISD